MNSLWSLIAGFLGRRDPCPEILEAAVRHWAKLNEALSVRIDSLEQRLNAAEARAAAAEAERDVLLREVAMMQRELIRLAR